MRETFFFFPDRAPIFLGIIQLFLNFIQGLLASYCVLALIVPSP